MKKVFQKMLFQFKVLFAHFRNEGFFLTVIHILKKIKKIISTDANAYKIPTVLPAGQLEIGKLGERVGITLEGKSIVDIGGPSNIFYPIYDKACSIDIVNFCMKNAWGNLEHEYYYKDRLMGKVIENDATELKDIHDETYDVVLSSNNLEHIANPMKAVSEWKRILKYDGILIILVPAKEYTFDHNRKVVTFSHILDDYEKNVKEDDLSHLEEILELHDLRMDPPAGTFTQFKERSMNNYKNRCLHQHVFDQIVLWEIAKYFNMEILPNDKTYLSSLGNWILVARKIKKLK